MACPTKNMLSTGDVGELLVISYLEKQGHTVERSASKFDRVKDFIKDGLLCEVKTQVPWLIRNSFTVRINQVIKITNADEVYFVAVPNKKYPSINDGKLFVWRKRPDRLIPINYETVKNRDMALIPINELEYVTTFSDEEMTKLMETSNSYYN